MSNAKKLRKTIEWERLEISFRKLEIQREYFMQGWAQYGQKCYGTDRSRDIKKKWQEYREELWENIFMNQLIKMV